jgi:hypothetical protein
MTDNNLELWDAVRTPDPEHTKKFNRGGFVGTATNVTYTIRELTRAFGPVGLGWGYEIVDQDYVPSGSGDLLHVIQINFWYLHDGQKCSFPQIGQTEFATTAKRGTPEEYKRMDGEAPKKSLSDAITKAASFLGFSADIHLGLWDDSKYVAKVREEKARESSKSEHLAKIIASMEASDPFGVAFALASLSQEEQESLFSGTLNLSSKQKSRVRELNQQAATKVDEYSMGLSQCVEQDDALAVQELWDELSDEGKRMVWKQLGPEVHDYIKKMKESA